MRRLVPVLAMALCLPLLGLVGPASATPATPATAATPPAGDLANVEYVNNLPEAKEATAINFLRYGRREIMVVTGRFGLQSYDLANPAAPRLLDSVGNDVLALPTDPPGTTFWQNEDMNVDQRRKLVYLARDPRAYGGTTATGTSGVYIVDAKDPADLKLITFHELPAGHTSTCINDCRYLWTGGPAKAATQPAEWGGRPIWVTDVRDPANPVTHPEPIDTGRNDGKTDYSHDVQVDDVGVAWVSGRGGVRGYWTSGRRYDPLQGRTRLATATNPVPYAGGGIEESAADSRFMHNTERPTGPTGSGQLIYSTEEDFQADCASDGQFVISSLEGSYGGEAWRSTPEQPFRLRTVGTWGVADKEGSDPEETSCSAHYFQIKDGLVAYSWYGQGTRFLDVTDPTNPIQVAYYRPDETASWATYFYKDYIYVADHVRGVDIIKLTDAMDDARADRDEVLAPAESGSGGSGAPASGGATAVKGYVADEAFGWACRLPTAS